MILAVSTSLILFFSVTYAQADSLGELASSSLEARLKANQYSFDEAAIGILIAYGKGNGSTADEFGKAFVDEINKRGEKARYFYYEADWKGIAIEYYIGYSAMGPWDAQTAAANVSKAVARMKAAKRVHHKADELLKE